VCSQCSIFFHATNGSIARVIFLSRALVMCTHTVYCYPVLRDVFPYSVVRFLVITVILFPLRVWYPHRRNISHVQNIMAICSQNSSTLRKSIKIYAT
jgi:hypothetical protein